VAPPVEAVSPEGQRRDERYPLAPRLKSLHGVTLGVLDNAKPNANHLLHEIAAGLRRVHGVARVVEFSKKISGVPAPPETIRSLAMECAVVLTGSGD
jgi:hypothetical protein